MKQQFSMRPHSNSTRLRYNHILNVIAQQYNQKRSKNMYENKPENVVRSLQEGRDLEQMILGFGIPQENVNHLIKETACRFARQYAQNVEYGKDKMIQYLNCYVEQYIQLHVRNK